MDFCLQQNVLKIFSSRFVKSFLPVSSAQRSAQELPAVERQDLDRCSVRGGQQMVLTGQNFTSDSRVMFSEKTQGEEELEEPFFNLVF